MPLAFGRTTTWALAVWSVYIAAWAAVSGSDPALVATWWLAGVGLVQAIAHHAARPEARLDESVAEDGCVTPREA
jgi:hypothetical protein